MIASDDAPGVGDTVKTSEKKVTVTVTDVEEAGEITLDRAYPQVGILVTPTLTDGDVPSPALTWKWYTTSSGGTAIISSTYQPTQTGTLRVEATYDDDGETKTVKKVVSVRAEVAPADNSDPTFANPGGEGRKVAEDARYRDQRGFSHKGRRHRPAPTEAD